MISQAEKSLIFRTAWPRTAEALVNWVGSLGDLTGPRPAPPPAPPSRSATPRIVCVAGSKGGPGKTTLAANLGAAWAATGADVLMLDADVRQHSLAAWSALRLKRYGEHATPLVITAAERQLATRVREARNRGWAITIVDLPGGDTALNGQILAESDLVLVATRPTGLDIRAALRMSRQLAALEVKHRFVLTQTPPSAARVDRARELLTPRAPMLASTMGSRVVYQDAIACGAGVTQLTRHDPAVEEIRALLDEVRRLPELRRGRA